MRIGSTDRDPWPAVTPGEGRPRAAEGVRVGWGPGGSLGKAGGRAGEAKRTRRELKRIFGSRSSVLGRLLTQRALQEITGVSIGLEQGFDRSAQPQIVTTGSPEEVVPFPGRSLEGLLEKPGHALPP